MKLYSTVELGYSLLHSMPLNSFYRLSHTFNCFLHRFSLLLLEPGEVFFEDHKAECQILADKVIPIDLSPKPSPYKVKTIFLKQDGNPEVEKASSHSDANTQETSCESKPDEHCTQNAQTSSHETGVAKSNLQKIAKKSSWRDAMLLSVLKGRLKVRIYSFSDRKLIS